MLTHRQARCALSTSSSIALHGARKRKSSLNVSRSNLIANMLQIQQSENLTPADSLIGVLPMWHIYALQLLLAVAP
jgi:hypothetical protein